MIGLDTNVLVRYVVGDNPGQFEVAAQVLEERCSVVRPGFVSNVVLCELAWVLGRAYRYPTADVLHVVETLMRTVSLHVESLADTAFAVADAREGLRDFADCLIARQNLRYGCVATVTFDRKAARHQLVELLVT